MKRFAAVVFSLILSISVGLTSASAAEPYSFENTPLSSDEAIFVISEPGYEGVQDSSLTVQPGPGAQGDGRVWYHCASMSDPKCTQKNLVPDLAWLNLPMCLANTSTACIESLALASKGQDFQESKFLRTAAGGIRINAEPKFNLLEGVTPSLFESTNAPNAGETSNYAVVVRVSEHTRPGSSKFEFGDVVASVIPYKEVTGNYRANYIDSTKEADRQYVYDGKSSSCVWLEDGKCGVRQDFAEGTKVRLKFRIPNKIGGWFNGRMKSPVISVTPASDSTNLISVEAESVQVPQFEYVQKKSEITDVVKNFNIGRGGSKNGEFWAVTAGGPGSNDTFKYIDYFRSQTKDTAKGLLSFWSLRTIGAANGGANGCIADTSKVLGVVTTNSMSYDTGNPTYEKGFLNYNVAGLHYMPDGKTAVEGTYDLVMRSDVARCFYGFTKAPVSAKISVVNDAGESKVATTLVSEKDGWLKMAAYGFNFSSPTIRVRLTQSKVVAKSTITCVKGKLVKVVTAVGPTCPAGYKKR